MDQVRLGASGLQVSRICLGAMSFGVPERGHTPWSLDADDSRPLLRRALDAGITFIDTANVYSDGSSEEIVGRALHQFVRRDDIVVATKVGGRTRPGPYGAGLSRKAILAEIDNSLRRLGMDYVDLYQIHRWDPTTPIEETLEALTDVVKAGKARYLGASSMHAWQFSKALHLAAAHGWSRFVSMQNLYNLLYREEEREMLPLCREYGIGVLPYSPLARGRLTRPWAQRTRRLDHDQYARTMYTDDDRTVVDAVGEVAAQRGLSRAQVALAWIASRPGVTAPIVGVTSEQHLDEAVDAVQLELTQDEINRLEAPYAPHRVIGFT